MSLKKKWELNKSYVIAILCIIVLWQFMSRNNTTETTYKVVSDTITVDNTDTVFIEVPRVEFVENDIPPPDTIEVEVPGDTVFVYTGKFETDSLAIDYTAKVKGTLEEISFGVVNKYPVVTNTTTKTITNTITKYPSGLYVGGTFHGNSVSFGATFIKDRNMITAEYGLDQTIHIGYKFRLFK